jgi:phospholipid/cholesterol/gamma-HCH transport system ATP-binding protein
LDSLVKVRNLYYKRNGRPVFSDINLLIPRGKITAIMGPSGCGKTTLLRLIGGQLKPESGEIVVNDKLVNGLARTQLYELRRKLGILFQSSALFTNLTVFENIAFPLREHTRLPDFMIRDIVLMKLQSVGLRGAADLMPSQLSGGMARRIALARAIALDPELIMYDEPFTGLDPIALGVIIKLICDLNTALGMTTILVSHDVQEVMHIADYIYVIASGKIIGQGSPEALKLDKNPEIEQFLLGLPDGVVPFHYPAVDYTKELFSSTSTG